MPTWFKILQGSGVVMFAAFAAVQYNDPDAWVWIVFYGAAGLFCALSLTRFFRWPGSAIFAAGALFAAFYLGRRVIGQQQLIGDEEGREMLGLLLTGLWMAFTTVSVWRFQGLIPKPRTGTKT